MIQLNDSASFHSLKMYDTLLQRKVFSFLSNGQVMNDFIIWKEICMLNVFLLFHKIDSRRMRSRWPNSMTVQAFICEKMYDIFCKGKFLVPYQRVKSWGILLFERKYVYWMYFCFFIKLNQGEWGLIDSTQWQCKPSFAKMYDIFYKGKFFGFLSKGQIMRDFIIWKEIWKTLNKENRR